MTHGPHQRSSLGAIPAGVVGESSVEVGEGSAVAHIGASAASGPTTRTPKGR